MSQPCHVVVLGCGRSGTSIFGELFQHVPGYSYRSEPPFEDLCGYDYDQPVAIKVPQPAVGKPVSPGPPFLVDELLAAVPQPRAIFWQVRHPLDTICSLRVGIARNWGHHPRPPDWRDWLSRPLLLRCAHHWRYLNTVGYAAVADLATINRFEPMVRDPLDCARRTCRRIGLDPGTCDAELRAWARRVQDVDNDDFDEAECSKPYSRPDHATRIDRWRENLTAAEVSDLAPLVGDAAARFGYQLPA